MPGAAAGVQVIALDLEKIAVSAGAACSSGKVQTSHVLRAMDLGPLAGQAIRVSLPWNVTRGDIDAFVGAYHRVSARLRTGIGAEADLDQLQVRVRLRLNSPAAAASYDALDVPLGALMFYLTAMTDSTPQSTRLPG